MTFNKHLVEEKSTLLKNKLDRISQDLANGLGSGELQTEEQVITEAAKVLEEFFKFLTEPSLQLPSVVSGDLPEAELYNQLFQEILDDLIVLFSELESIESFTVSNFNFVATEVNRLTARLKNVLSLLGDYQLYAQTPTKDVIYFKDSFNDLSRIDPGSPLLNATECYINQDEGIVTLPIDTAEESIIDIKETPIINESSNGASGNNQQLGAAFNGDLDSITDNNPDTWFEYENVVTSAEDTREPLILDITINLGEERFVNYIRVNPNNFGTKTSIEIDRIETSLDGRSFLNIKDDIPIADFATKDEENIFLLAPSTSKYAGQGLYTFTPRRAKYVHFLFRQTESFPIETPQGTKYRYAIGIRDIEVRGFRYLSTGEIVSRNITLNDDIRKVGLEVNQNPTEPSELAGIEYFVSPDNGQHWYPIQSKQFFGISGDEAVVPEIVNFNGSEENTIQTERPVRSLRFKAVFKREDDAFDDSSSTFRKEIAERSELQKVPEASPFEVTLNFPPVKDSLQIIDPLYGSRGFPENPYLVGVGGRTSNFFLPIDSFPRPFKKTSTGDPAVYSLVQTPISEWLYIKVAGEEWTHINQPFSSYNGNFSNLPAYRLYSFNQNTGELKFGSGHNTMAPPDSAAITAYFNAELLFPTETNGTHIAKLDYKTSNDKTSVILDRYEEEEETLEILPKKALVIHLANKNITSTTNLATLLNSLGFDASATTFINGKEEITSSTKWSIDTENGIVYLGAATSASTEYSFSYKYQTITTLTEDDWDWETTEVLRDSIVIKDSAWKTFSREDLYLPVTSGLTVLDLADLAVVKGSLKLTLTDDGEDAEGEPDDDGEEVPEELNPFIKEVPYINGASELGKAVAKRTENMFSLDPGVSNIATYNLRERISSDVSAHIVTFSNKDVFLQEDENLDTVGDYYIERDPTNPLYGQLSVKLSSTEAVAGDFITYYSVDRRYTDNGLYSVDYRNGRIYTQRAMQGGDWSLTATYQYTDYRIKYKMARLLPSNSFTVDLTANIVTIKDEELAKRNLIYQDKQDFSYYQFNYDYIVQTREDIADLKDYFSPVLKDYVLKVITKSLL